MRIYLAGPCGFSEAGQAFHRDRLVPAIRSLGFVVLDPWELTRPNAALVGGGPYGTETEDDWQRNHEEIATNNLSAIDRADGLVAVLDGADVDSGTAAEIGYAFARRRPILGYRGDCRSGGGTHGAIVNLQVEYFIRASGGTIIRQIDDLPAALQRMLPSRPFDQTTDPSEPPPRNAEVGAQPDPGRPMPG